MIDFKIFFQKVRSKLVLTSEAKKLLVLRLGIFFLVIFVLVAIAVVKQYQLVSSLPLILEDPVIEFTNQPTPKSSPTKPVQIIAPVGNRVIVKKGHPLCEGVTDPWTLVPDPEKEGQYIVCNSENGQMATVNQLNIAQNNYRVANGLNALSINNDLCKVAAERASEISDKFSHDGFEAAVERNNIQKSAVGENIASGPLSAVQFVEWSWDRSPGHRANMLGDWTEGCAGVHDRFAVYIFAR